MDDISKFQTFFYNLIIYRCIEAETYICYEKDSGGYKNKQQ